MVFNRAVDRQLLYREFGLALGLARRRRHLSQEQFGAKVGLSRASVTNVERGRQPVQLHQLYLFAAVLEINVSKLLPPELSSHTGTQSEMEAKNSKYLADLEKVSKRQ